MSLKVTLLGTGVGIPMPGRAQSAILVQNEMRLLFDCGAGTIIRLTEAMTSVRNLDTVVLTHLHLDHTSDLLALASARYLMQLNGLEVYGPEGTDQWFRKIHDAHPYLEKMETVVHELRPYEMLCLKGLNISIEEARHSVPALSYRIESESKAMVYSGDTEPLSRIAEMAEGADLLIHECSFPEPFEVTNHSTPKKLGSLIRGVKKVILTHLYPETRGHEEEMKEDFRAFSGISADIGMDLQTIKL